MFSRPLQGCASSLAVHCGLSSGPGTLGKAGFANLDARRGQAVSEASSVGTVGLSCAQGFISSKVTGDNENLDLCGEIS